MFVTSAHLTSIPLGDPDGAAGQEGVAHNALPELGLENIPSLYMMTDLLLYPLNTWGNQNVLEHQYCVNLRNLALKGWIIRILRSNYTLINAIITTKKSSLFSIQIDVKTLCKDKKAFRKIRPFLTIKNNEVP